MKYSDNVYREAPTLDDMLDGVDAALAVPDPIGSLGGAIVYLHHDTREISIGTDIRCSVDHPYLAGTPIQEAALRRLGETEQGRSTDGY